MPKTTNLYVRIEPDLKEQAEEILHSLGIPVSSAINMFYRQIVIQRGIPFELKLPKPNIPYLNELTEDELDAELKKGIDDIANGKAKPAKQVFRDIHKE